MSSHQRYVSSLAALCLTAVLASRTSLATRQLLGVTKLAAPVFPDVDDASARADYALTTPPANGGSITVDPFLLVGGSSGTRVFFWDPTKGGLLQTLDVWVGKTSVTGIRMRLSSGAVHQWGQQHGAHASLALALGEKLVNVSLWDNGLAEPKTRFGALRIHTNAGQRFDAGVPLAQRGRETPVLVGSGYVVGATGHTGDDVAAFGLCFLRPVLSATMQVSAYPALQTLSAAGGNLTEVLAYVTYNNFGDNAEVVRMMGAPTVTAVHEWNFNASEKLGGVPVSVTAGVPRVVDVGGVPTGWTVSEASRWATKTREEVRRGYDLPLTVPPHTTILAKATLAKLDVDVDFKGKVTVALNNGATWQYRMSGRYTGLAYAVTVTLGGNETIAADSVPGLERSRGEIVVS